MMREKEIQYFIEIITCNPSLYTMDQTDFIVGSFMENSTGLKSVIKGTYNLMRDLNCNTEAAARTPATCSLSTSKSSWYRFPNAIAMAGKQTK